MDPSEQIPELTKTYRALTRHPAGSVRELFYISFPLMLTIFSGTLMFFIDRLILARYSLDAMNAAAIAGMTCAIFELGAVNIANIAEVFVGQLNGGGQFDQLGKPVWQMIWFSLMSTAVFVPLAHWAGPFFLQNDYEEMGLPYYQILMYFGPLLPIFAALSSFFVGQGKVKLITFSAIVGNLINAGLDIVLVFGIKGVLPPMGTKGAAIATVLSEVLQIVLLGSVFLNKHHRAKHGTLKSAFDFPLFLRCLRIGMPNAIGRMLEVAAWAAMLHMMSWVSKAHVTTLAIGQNVFILFVFMTDGLSKGVVAITSNFIGAKRWNKIKEVLSSAVKIEIVIMLVLSIPLLFFPNLLVDIFLKHSETLNVPHQQIILYARHALVGVWFYLVFDVFAWVIAGVLTAAGDTLFLMFVNAFNVWVFAIIPIYLIVVLMGAPPGTAWKLSFISGLANAVLMYMRYRGGRWKLRSL